MPVTLLKAKLHCVCVTHSNPLHEDGLAIDGDLLDLAGIYDYEQIQVYNASSGEYLTSYAVRAEHGSRVVAMNGAAMVGDRLIICAYVKLNAREMVDFKPAVVYCDEQNHVIGSPDVIPLLRTVSEPIRESRHMSLPLSRQ